MKIVVISDTHGEHEALGILEGDVLIHCGDVEQLFRPDEEAVGKVDEWFGRQRFDRIFCIGGNHDLGLERAAQTSANPFRNAVFLHDRTELYRGLTFHGSSWVPMLQGHAFFADDRDLVAAWRRVPKDVDVLVTHTPPAGILDMSSRDLALGCEHLSARLQGLNPMLHCFGHVHASRGTERTGGTTYANATNVNSDFEIAYPPMVFDLPG
ncbi:MAG: metallophosphatase domain-containing protein [Pseudomonadota bacterium]